VTRRWNDRLALWNWRSSIVSLALVGMVIISAIGAWSVRASWLEHQRAVEQTLDEYARYAARTFYQSVVNEQFLMLARTMAPVTGAVAYEEARLALPGFAKHVEADLARMMAGFQDPRRGYFRVDETTGHYQALGRLDDSLAARAVRELVKAERGTLDTMAMRGTVLPLGRDSVTLVFALQRTASGRPIALYGYSMSIREDFAPMMEQLLPRFVLLPPSVLGTVAGESALPRTDTLVSLKMIEDDGTLYYATPTQFVSSAVGEYRGRRPPLRVEATLHPNLVARLRAEMLDESRRRLQLALPLIAVLFAVAAILHIHRERELVRARRDFVASVSHELRTPLAQIRMFSETLLLRREENEEERMRWLGIIGREARRLGDLVENILLFSHIDAARVRLEPERTDVGELVEEVVEAYVPIAEARKMRIVADSPSRIFAIVDPRALRQIVVNLVDNALKYGPAGQTVTVEVERNTTVARLAVSDEGPGVAKSDRARLWRPFVRLANAGSTIGGSGIGLAVVRSLVHQHGGSVAVDDANEDGGDGGRGARFVVTIPLASSNSPSHN
jgi:signal transduction histidine kinase